MGKRQGEIEVTGSWPFPKALVGTSPPTIVYFDWADLFVSWGSGWSAVLSHRFPPYLPMHLITAIFRAPQQDAGRPGLAVGDMTRLSL